MEGFRYRDPKCVKGDPKSGGDPIKTPKMGEGSPKVGVGDPKWGGPQMWEGGP